MNRVSMWVILACLGSLVWLSVHLATNRIYQVDECQYVYMARVLHAHQEKTFFTDASGFTIPLSWLDRGASSSAEVFTSARFAMSGLFWLNLVLIALCTGEKLRSKGGLIALLFAATLAPLWDYGIEIRHDNVLLTGLLLSWCVLRVFPKGWPSYFVAGALALGLQFFVFKAFAYTTPLALAFLLFPPAAHKSPRWKLILAWIAGALITFLVARLAYGALGLWQEYVTDLRGISGVSAHTKRLAPWTTLGRLLTQTPLLLALIIAALTAVLDDLRRLRREALSWDVNLPEALLFLGTAGVLFVNPNPYPYNLLQLVPFAFIFTFRYAMRLKEVFVNRPAFLPVACSILLFVHLVPFGIATRRHFDFTNTRQQQLMSVAENLTDARTDPVYDAIGMVPTRPSIAFRWFLHSLNIQSFTKGPGPHVHDMLAEKPAAVLIPSYRTDWLPEEDHDFIQQRYVALADDFFVLGKVLPAGGGTFDIFRTGRYRISTLQGSDSVNTASSDVKEVVCSDDAQRINGTLDGAPLADRPVELSAGQHRIETSAPLQTAVVWIGPRLDRVPRIGAADHSVLFCNWY